MPAYSVPVVSGFQVDLVVLEPCLAVVACWAVVLEICSGVVACSAHLQAVQLALVVHTRYVQEACSVPVDYLALDQGLELQVANFALAARIPPLLVVYYDFVDMSLVLRAYFEFAGLGEIQVVASVARSAHWMPYWYSYSGP